MKQRRNKPVHDPRLTGSIQPDDPDAHWGHGVPVGSALVSPTHINVLLVVAAILGKMFTVTLDVANVDETQPTELVPTTV